jgi:hypothetical protein
MPNREGKSPIEKSEQEVQNWSFDEEFKVLAVEPVTYNPVTGNLERSSDIQGNGSLKFTYTDGNVTKIEKTIGTKTYTKTLTYDGSDVTDITAWV